MIAPLDWGLGHAARCVPLIKQLQEQDNSIIIACNDWQKAFFEGELRGVGYAALFGYEVKYSQNIALGLKVLAQFPRLSLTVRKENLWLKNFLKKEKIDVVISDNRYGFYNKAVESVFITHQLFVPAPFLKGAVNRINFSFIKKFDHCWVPDQKEENASLSGKLSHGNIPENVTYIGPLSRFEKRSAEEKDDRILLLLSGVEPQRSILEEKLVSALGKAKEEVALVRGTHKRSSTKYPTNFTVYDTVNSSLQEKLMRDAGHIICRSGYSTLMDLHALGLKALLIPTPGQTEQEYLAEHWKEKFGYTFLKQKEVNKGTLTSLLCVKGSSQLQQQPV